MYIMNKNKNELNLIYEIRIPYSGILWRENMAEFLESLKGFYREIRRLGLASMNIWPR